MGHPPLLVKTVNEEIGAAVGHLNAEKDVNTDLVLNFHSLLVIRKIEFQPLGIGQGSVNVDISVKEMVGNKYSLVTRRLVKLQGAAHGGAAALADGAGVKVSFVKIHFRFLSVF
jgi:hypothetical protein